MTNPQTEAMDKSLHQQAKTLAKNYVNDFATSLLLQAKLIAYHQKAEVVLSGHVEEARDLIFTQRKKSRGQELSLAIGGALFGAFIQGFINELSLSTLRPLWIAIYTVAGFVGIFFIFWGLRR